MWIKSGPRFLAETIFCAITRATGGGVGLGPETATLTTR